MKVRSIRTRVDRMNDEDYAEKMLVETVLIAGVAFLVYQAAHYFARRSLDFSPMNHEPMYIPGASPSSFPLVCVLGWGGCTRRQLRRLLDFYSSHGIATISWINPMGDYLFGVDRQQVERVLDLLLLRDQRGNGIVIHLHSNNGALVWSRMLSVMTSDTRYSSLLDDVNGIILDSAPFVHLDGSSEWIVGTAFGVSRPCVSIILNRAQYVHWLWTPLIIYYIAIRLAYQRYFTSEVSTSLKQIRDSLNATPTQITQYYLYSHADLLIPYRTIEQVMSMQARRGVNVMSHRFADSGHVNHFRLHPEEYGKVVRNFLAMHTKRSPSTHDKQEQ